MIVGLRVDVDTLRGTRLGVPSLCDMLKEHSIQASFFFSVGPDNMGRHLWRLLRPAFLIKMLRSNAASLYGWDILLKGTFWPGPWIGAKSAETIRLCANHGHDIGLHAWDHHAWQSHIDKLSPAAIAKHLKRAYDCLESITGQAPTCSAVPAWKCTESTLLAKEALEFAYNSDCRGTDIFKPIVDGRPLTQIQIPVTLPTYDEIIGHDGITDNTYNDHLFSLMKPDTLNCLTIHAEVEGIARQELFKQFLKKASTRGIQLVSLGSLLAQTSSIKAYPMKRVQWPGREGWISVQKSDSQTQHDSIKNQN